MLKDVSNLFTEYGCHIFFRMRSMIFFIFYLSLLYSISFFFFIWFNSYSASSIHDSLYCFLYCNIFTIFTSCIGMFYEPFDRKIIRQFPGIYLSGTVEKNMLIRRFLVREFVECIC